MTNKMTDIESIIGAYQVPRRAAELYMEAKRHIDTEAGYRAFYELEKFVKANNLETDILFDLAADFAWDGSLNEAVERMRLEEA